MCFFSIFSYSLYRFVNKNTSTTSTFQIIVKGVIGEVRSDNPLKTIVGAGRHPCCKPFPPARWRSGLTALHTGYTQLFSKHKKNRLVCGGVGSAHPIELSRWSVVWASPTPPSHNTKWRVTKPFTQ